MTKELHFLKDATKQEKYELLIKQVKALSEGESDFIANVANIMAALKTSMSFFWVGCYFVKGNQLVLGPFQGSVACTRIDKGKGVCGKAWEDNKIILVSDVDTFPGHIACSSYSRSEIVLPGRTNKGEVFMVLDVDSDKLADFDEIDKVYLQELVQLIEPLYNL